MRVGVIGAGPTGLTAALHLATNGTQVEVFEASAEIGGLGRSIELWGRSLDLSAHIFATSNPEVADIWRRMIGEDYRLLDLRRGIFNGRGIISYPLRPIEIVRRQALSDSFRCAVDFAFARLKPRTASTQNAARWMIARYGRRPYELFFKQYALKLWGESCEAIDAAFAHALLGESHASTLGEQRFPYPMLGTGSVWRRMSEAITELGGEVHISSPVEGLLVAEACVEGLVSAGRAHRFDHVVSTLPLAALIRMLPDCPDSLRLAAGRLHSRSTVLVYLLLHAERSLDYCWVSIYPPSLRLGRVTDFNAWHGAAGDGLNVFCLEYWCDANDELWTSADEALISLAVDELRQTGLLGTITVAQAHVERVRGTHPVFSLGFQHITDALQSFAGGFNGITSIGRHGRHGVPGIGACMEMGIAAAEAVLFAPAAGGTAKPAAPMPQAG